MQLIEEPSPLSFDAIRDYAEHIGRHHNIYDERGRANVDDLMTRLGGRIVVSDTNESMHIADKGNFVIHVPGFTSLRRDRFTKAHEIGHYFLHYRYLDKAGPAAFARGGRGLQETQANIFAASLLMPAKEFTRAHRKTKDSWELANIFDVSPAAAGVRAKVLGLA